MILSYGAKPVPVKNVLLLLFALALALTAGRGLWLVISTEDAAAEFSYDYALSAINAGPAYAEAIGGRVLLLPLRARALIRNMRNWSGKLSLDMILLRKPRKGLLLILGDTRL